MTEDFTGQTFPHRPRLELLGQEWYGLLEPYRVYWVNRVGYNRLTVYPDFQCDLASIPQPGRWIVGKYDLLLSPPLIHDLLYACKGNVHDYEWADHEVWDQGNRAWATIRTPWDRWDVDKFFGWMMRKLSVACPEKKISRWKRRSAVKMTSWFGQGAWERTRPGNQEWKDVA